LKEGDITEQEIVERPDDQLEVNSHSKPTTAGQMKFMEGGGVIMGLGMIKKNEKEHKSYDEYLDKKKEISNAEEYLEDPQPSQSSGSSESRRGESVGHDLSHKNKSVRIFDATPS